VCLGGYGLRVELEVEGNGSFRVGRGWWMVRCGMGWNGMEEGRMDRL